MNWNGDSDEVNGSTFAQGVLNGHHVSCQMSVAFTDAVELHSTIQDKHNCKWNTCRVRVFSSSVMCSVVSIPRQSDFSFTQI
jgi:hypothetical protein